MAKNRLNISMFGHKHILSREGGVEIVVNELATRMVERGHHVTCYDRSTHHVSGGTIKHDRKFKGVNIVPVWTIEKKGIAAMTSSFSAAWRSAWGKYDVVHIHAEGPAAMSWLPKLRGKKVVVTIHGLDWARSKWGGIATRYIKWGEKQAVKWADKIIVLSRNVQNYFLEEYGKKTVYIPNGVVKPNPQPAEEIKRLWGLEKDSYILFLGRIVPEKGLTYLINAWKKTETEKKLVIAGGSSDTEEYLQQLVANSPESIIFTGFQQGHILEELYSNSYIYCLPSDLEGMPLSLLEAMSYGNCCLISDIPECLEAVGDKAVSFFHGNIDDLQGKLQFLLDSPEVVAKYKSEAADYVCKTYNWDDVVDKTIELYKSC